MGKTTEDTAMELDGEGAANFEQLQDLIRKECDKRDRKYARLEDKCNKLEQQVKNPQKKHAKEGPLSKSRRTRRLEEKQIKPKERSKTTKSRSKSAPVNNSGGKNRRNPETPGQAGEKNSDSKQKSANKPPPPSQSKSPRNPPNYSGKEKNPPKKQQRKNKSPNLDLLVTQPYLNNTTPLSPSQKCQPGTNSHGHPTWPSTTSRNDTNHKKTYGDSSLDSV